MRGSAKPGGLVGEKESPHRHTLMPCKSSRPCRYLKTDRRSRKREPISVCPSISSVAEIEVASLCLPRCPCGAVSPVPRRSGKHTATPLASNLWISSDRFAQKPALPACEIPTMMGNCSLILLGSRNRIGIMMPGSTSRITRPIRRWFSSSRLSSRTIELFDGSMSPSNFAQARQSFSCRWLSGRDDRLSRNCEARASANSA